jgi:2-C-methyl-D-erythritol 2,4-cyclodiphosphate synthase
MTNFRIGQGYDVHQLAPDYDLWLGGIKIDHHLGAVGHSDADVLIHVICDALLGATNQGDIGQHFPDTDPKYKGIDSKKLLAEVCTIIRDLGYEIGNIDSTIMAQKPKLMGHIPAMQMTLAETMGVDADLVSIKATTTEKLSFVGREEGIAAQAVALVYKK